MCFCGDIFHDSLIYLGLAFPFLAPAVWWLRHKLLGKHEHDHG